MSPGGLWCSIGIEPQLTPASNAPPSSLEPPELEVDPPELPLPPLLLDEPTPELETPELPVTPPLLLPPELPVGPESPSPPPPPVASFPEHASTSTATTAHHPLGTNLMRSF